MKESSFEHVVLRRDQGLLWTSAEKSKNEVMAAHLESDSVSGVGHPLIEIFHAPLNEKNLGDAPTCQSRARHVKGTPSLSRMTCNKPSSQPSTLAKVRILSNHFPAMQPARPDCNRSDKQLGSRADFPQTVRQAARPVGRNSTAQRAARTFRRPPSRSQERSARRRSHRLCPVSAWLRRHPTPLSPRRCAASPSCSERRMSSPTGSLTRR